MQVAAGAGAAHGDWVSQTDDGISVAAGCGVGTWHHRARHLSWTYQRQTPKTRNTRKTRKRQELAGVGSRVEGRTLRTLRNAEDAETATATATARATAETSMGIWARRSVRRDAHQCSCS